MKLRGVSLRHTVELLKGESSLAAACVGVSGEPVKRTTVRSLSAPVALKADDRARGGINTYSYVGGNPASFVDPQGLVIDIIADIGFIGYDIYRLINAGLHQKKMPPEGGIKESYK